MKKNFVKTFAVLAVLLLAVTGFVPVLPVAEADQANYFEGQLSGNSAKMYDALEALAGDANFQAGTASYDAGNAGLSVNGPVSNATYNLLVADFDKAVSAFELDHPELFYVDYSKLTLRVLNSDENGSKVVIGAGKDATYLLDGLTAGDVAIAVGDFEAKLNEYVNECGAGINPETMVGDLTEKLTQEVAIKGEAELGFGESATYQRTAYGALVNGKANAEGVAKAVSAVLNAMNVENVYAIGLEINYGRDEWLQADNCIPTPTAWNLVKNGADWAFVNVAKGGDYLFVDADSVEDEFQVANVAGFSYPALADGYNVSRNDQDVLVSGNTVGIAEQITAMKSVSAPTIVMSPDMDATDWTLDDGTPIDVNSAFVLDLVYYHADEGSGLYDRTDDFYDFAGTSFLALDAYELELYLGGKSVNSTGNTGKRVNVLFPYPAGYGYNSVGVTYEARVFDKYEGHTFSDHDEVDSMYCIATPYGLLLDLSAFNSSTYGNSTNTCNYAIIAKSGTDQSADKAVITVINGNGISAGASIQVFNSGNASVQVASDNGFVIDSVTVNGVKQDITSRSEVAVNVNYDTADSATVVEVNLIASATFNAEQQDGWYSVNSKLDAPSGGGNESPSPSTEPSTSPDNGGNGGNGGTTKPSFSCNFGGAIGAGNLALVAICVVLVGIGKGFIR